MHLTTVDSHLLFRIAMLPFWNLDIKKHILPKTIYSQSIYSSSISLHRQYVTALTNGQPIEKNIFPSLTRYHLRMATRPIPFGFFAGCGITGWNEQIQIDTQRAQYHTRLDNLVLHQLAQRLFNVPAIQDQLRYFPNNSLYSAHDELRYVEYTLTEQKRDYRLSAVSASDALKLVLQCCQAGARWSEVASHLVCTLEVELEEAEGYVQELIDSQLLVGDLEPAITGEEYLPRLIRWVAALNNSANGHSKSIVPILSLLEDIQQRLDQIKEGTTTVIEQGPIIVDRLRAWLPDLTESKLFQVDTIFPTKDAAAPIPTQENKLPAQLSEAIEVLNKLAPPTAHSALTRFAERFTARYEDQEVSLAEALDIQLGIDYLNDIPTSLSPLVEELNLPVTDEEQSVTWTKLEQWQWNLLQQALYHQQATVELTDDMLKDFTVKEEDLPPSMSVMFRRVEDNSLYLDSVGGVSATNLINRFAHADPNIHRLVQDICDQEQQYNPDVVFAEIVHLPESRVGNIMFHPTSRAYEIPYLATSAVDEAHQISLFDLRLSVRKGRIILRSARLDKEVVPRLSTAHNHRLSELAVYRFLCDLQGQGLRPYLSFSWGALAVRCKFLPRVVYKNIILHPATWQLEAADFVELKRAKNPDDFWQVFQRFLKKWRLPQQWVLADGDNELFVDSEYPHIVEAWWDLAKKRNQLTIKEFFAPAKGAIVNEKGETHAHQLVATWIKQAPTYQTAKDASPSATVSRSSAPGSEWLYYKIYGGVSSADRILEEVVAPLVERLQEQKISQWFFIRYADPNPHLRLRFHLTDTAYLGEVMQQLHKAFAPFETSGMLSRIQLDTYHRELERYGGNAIAEAEALFHYDSEATLRFLALTEGDEREDLRWLWGLRSIDTLLTDFGLITSDKLSLLESMKDSFAREHRMDKPLKIQLDKKYRAHRSAIHRMLTLTDPSDEIYPLVEILQERSARQRTTLIAVLNAEKQGHLTLSLTDLLRSYIHMLVNRLISSQARLHELVLYDFLYREYRSDVART